MNDELARAIEATLFASTEPLTVDEVAEHVGEGSVESALEALAAQPYGTVLLALAAAGLVAYAVYMAVEARYRRFLGA